MKKILFSVFLFLPLLAFGQTVETQKDSLKGTGVTNAAKHTRGGGEFKYLRKGALPVAYKSEYIWIYLGSITDSVCIQSARVHSTSTSANDTTWQSVPLTYKKLAAINTAAGAAVVRDTTAKQWVSDLGRDYGVDQGIFQLPASVMGSTLRLMIGKNDTGTVYYEYMRVK